MLKIDRSCSQRIITSALQHHSSPLIGLLDADGKQFTPYPDLESLQQALSRKPDSMIVYNQDAGARSTIHAMDLSDSQIVIEIREETRGVLGLQATRHGDQSDIAMEW